jgi:hypothetical protein
VNRSVDQRQGDERASALNESAVGTSTEEV